MKNYSHISNDSGMTRVYQIWLKEEKDDDMLVLLAWERKTQKEKSKEEKEKRVR